jgi:hypothetical protein
LVAAALRRRSLARSVRLALYQQQISTIFTAHRKVEWSSVKPYFFVIIILLIFSTTDCKKNPVAPPPAESDTTSHAFIFNIFTFGGAGGSMLNDVAIINDTLVYAVGEIYQTDSTGQYDPFPYNLAIWNGNSWKLQKVAYNYQGQPYYHPIECIYAFSPNDIWLAGNGVQHWDGVQFDEVDLPISSWGQNQVNKIWGTNSSNFYIVGNGGSIAQYTGSSWTKFQSGTTLPINDIWGAQNSAGQWEILAIASNPDSTANMLMQIHPDNSISQLSTNGLLPFTTGIWFVPEKQYYVVGSGVGQKSSLNDPNWSVYPSGVVTSYASGGVRGNGPNDVFVAGSFFEIVHYNGSSWHNYKDVIPFTAGALGRLAVKGNLMATVGLSGQNAVAIIGKRE